MTLLLEDYDLDVLRPDVYTAIITGSRAWRGPEVLREIALLAEKHGDRLLIKVGDAQAGVDKLAVMACKAVGVEHEVFKADWGKHNKAAGYIRNTAMAESGGDECVAFALPCELPRCARRKPHLTHGTEHCMAECGKRCIPVRRVLKDGTDV